MAMLPLLAVAVLHAASAGGGSSILTSPVFLAGSLWDS
jgi:hypothetical protein